MKNVFFAIAFMLLGTFTSANNVANEKVRLVEKDSIELSVDYTTNTTVEFVEIIEDCEWKRFTKVTRVRKYFLGIKISDKTTTETVWMCV